MSSARSAPPLVLERRPSRLLALFLLIVHAAALAALGTPLQLPVWVRLLLGAAVALSMVFTLRREALLLSGGSVTRFGWSEADGWWLQTRAGVRRRMRLRADSVVLPNVMVLRFGSRWRRRTLVLPSDGADPQDLRRLRVRLRNEPGLRGDHRPPE